MDKKKIENTLLKLGIPASIKGFQYILDAIMVIEKSGLISVTKQLYPEIAEINKTTSNRVERSIRHAFEIVRSKRVNPEIIEHYIGFSNTSNANSLVMLHLRIKEECNEKKDLDDLLLEKIRKIVKMEIMLQLNKKEA